MPITDEIYEFLDKSKFFKEGNLIYFITTKFYNQEKSYTLKFRISKTRFSVVDGFQFNWTDRQSYSLKSFESAQQIALKIDEISQSYIKDFVLVRKGEIKRYNERIEESEEDKRRIRKQLEDLKESIN